MELINQIINELTDSEKTLSSSLLKAKFFAQSIKSVPLLRWINNELDGYERLYDETKEEVPKYRKTGARLLGSYYIGDTLFPNQDIPTHGLEERFGDSLRHLTVYDSVSYLESIVNGDEDSIGLSLPPEMCGFIEQPLRKRNLRLKLISAQIIAPANIVNQILTSIRSKLLDFMSELNDEFGEDVDYSIFRKSPDKISRIMYYTINGDGNIINSGDNSQINAEIKINKGSKETLSETLDTHNVDKSDIEDLLQIVDSEKDYVERYRKFGPSVSKWIQKMFGKAVNGSWQIGIGAAGSVLADAVEKYYGLK